MKIVKVKLGKRSYPIYIGVDLSALGPVLTRHCPNTHKTIIVTNELLSELYGEILEKSLKTVGYQVRTILVPDGEKYKTLEQAEKLYQSLLKEKIERFSPIIALGGGVIGDLTGFVSATFLRGLPLVQVPTTLVAQVDSSIGGKVGIDLPEGKNLVGAFYQPTFVWIDLKVLETLALEEMRNGFAEVIKYGIIQEAKFFNYLEMWVSDVGHLSLKFLEEIVYRSCKIKSEIVQKDECERTGLRRILNFGHTLGHVLEALTKYRIYKHGEAVSIGMVGATKIAEKMKLIKKEEAERIVNLLKKVELPTNWPKKYKLEKVYPYLEHDKKVKNGKINFVLPVKIGQVIVRNDVPKKILNKVLK
ncbi:MAG TPA: 3-dehydroquinate synthase [Elusimicrobia bacterium]|jgi:3-dehydroquinate synthase|nr:3-dehydroquinate synthase [Elusimicrobiota bacterium]